MANIIFIEVLGLLADNFIEQNRLALRVLLSTILGCGSADVVTGIYNATLYMRNLTKYVGILFTIDNGALIKT